MRRGGGGTRAPHHRLRLERGAGRGGGSPLHGAPRSRGVSPTPAPGGGSCPRSGVAAGARDAIPTGLWCVPTVRCGETEAGAGGRHGQGHPGTATFSRDPPAEDCHRHREPHREAGLHLTPPDPRQHRGPPRLRWSAGGAGAAVEHGQTPVEPVWGGSPARGSWRRVGARRVPPSHGSALRLRVPPAMVRDPRPAERDPRVGALHGTPCPPTAVTFGGLRRGRPADGFPERGARAVNARCPAPCGARPGGLRTHPQTPPDGRRLQEAGPPRLRFSPRERIPGAAETETAAGPPRGSHPTDPRPRRTPRSRRCAGRGRTPGSPSELGGEEEEEKGGCGVGEGGRGLRSQGPAQAGCGRGAQRGRAPRGGAVRDVPRAADPRTGSGDCRNTARNVPRVLFSGGRASTGGLGAVSRCPFPCPGACPCVPSSVSTLGTSWLPPPHFKQGPRGRDPGASPPSRCT